MSPPGPSVARPGRTPDSVAQRRQPMPKTVQTTPSGGSTKTDRPSVVLTGVSKSFPGVRALTDVHFDCKPGEVHALVGENGSGKSTLIKIASGVYTPDSGEAVIGGQPLAGGSVHRARKL